MADATTTLATAIDATATPEVRVEAGGGGGGGGDLALARRVAGGEAGALEELIAAHGAMVGRLARRLLGWPGRAEVEDVVQEVFVAALERAWQYRGEASLATWLGALTVNRCRGRRRAWRRLAEGLRRLAGLAGPSADADAAPSAAMEGRERAERVRRAVRALPARDREVIVLHHLEGRPVEEVAQVLGVRRNAAEVRLHRARRRLRELLTGPGEAEVW